MKKILSVLLSLVLLLSVPALADCGCDSCEACECAPYAQTILQANSSVLIAKSEITVQAGIYVGDAWFALTNENRVIGKISPFENQPVLPACPPARPYIGGCMENGLVRAKGSMAVMKDLSGAAFGLKSISVSIQIQQEHIALVESIVRNRLEVDEITANSIVAASMWWQETTVCHIFFLPSAPRVWVGTVTVNSGKAVIDLFAGDWNGDGIPEIGFTAGSSPATPEPTLEPTPELAPEPEITPEPEETEKPAPDPTPAPRNERAETRKECKPPVCVKNYYTTNIIQINNQVNINSKVTNVQKVGAPCRKDAQCVALGQ